MNEEGAGIGTIKLTARINRRRILTPGSKFAWKYLYDVHGLGRELYGFDMLSIAERKAKEFGATKIVRDWERYR